MSKSVEKVAKGAVDPARFALRCGGVVAAVVLAVLIGFDRPAAAAELSRASLKLLFPQAQGELQLGPVTGPPPAAEVRSGGQLVGYAYSTYAVTGSLGFSGKPLDVHVGLTTGGIISGALLATHEEPILVIGISPQALAAFVTTLAGTDIRQPIRALTGRKAGVPDHVAGATVSSSVIKDAVLRSSRAVASSRGLLGTTRSRAEIDRATFLQQGFEELLASGAVRRQTFSRHDSAKGAKTRADNASRPLMEVYVALLTPPTVGQSLLGRREFERLEGRLGAGQHAILIAANGLYSFKGSSWRQTGTFDKFQLVQGGSPIRLTREDHDNHERLATTGAPELREIGVFRVPAATGFDPTRPWRLDVTLDGEGAGGGPATMTLEYALPAQFLLAPTPVSAPQAAPVPQVPAAPPAPAATARPGEGAAAEIVRDARPNATVPVAAPPAARIEAPHLEATERVPELWEQIWRARTIDIALTVLLLVGLAVILFSHDILVRNVARYRAVRIGFLVATLLFLGFYAGAQLSVVHVVTFIHALMSGFRWEQFLLDPPIFILWSFVALALLFWGRGVFCGWLCPFGALQELVNEAARKLGVRQIEVPWALNERLWPIKYAAFLLILGVSLKSATQAFVLAEVEPFKTAITLKLMRAWPFVLYVVALLVAGIFIERFFCRYLCPLGAALAIPARLRLFEWLKRRPQCGRECRICATRCTVQAINPLGQIVPNECIYCLQCQANYYDARTCLPLKQRAQRRAGAGQPMPIED